MKIVLTKNSLILLTVCSVILCCKNRTEKLQQNKVYKSVISKKIEKVFIDSLNTLEHKIILNKVYIERKLIYEIEIFNSEKIVNAFKIPYHFISENDTLQADELRLSKNTVNNNHIKVKIENGFIIEFWQSETLFQYLVYFEKEDLYLRRIKRISEENAYSKKIKICEVALNENLHKLSATKIDSIINNFDNIKNINCN
ncbi:hypothetical protein [Flavobacterium hungaricum]|uniref:Lipoprotein n=1 Tax=Flavobacterium hungaricum TaxID=2082725 RepID=A0ABR9TN54_9FLAO|nr:hypothetical protein [Flavobacterium hungaricum]MBE8726785.1 hypothetical protein [Flavobacterium hungaricum]